MAGLSRDVVMISVFFVVLINLKVFVVVEIVAWVTLNMNVALSYWLELLNPPQWRNMFCDFSGTFEKGRIIFLKGCAPEFRGS